MECWPLSKRKSSLCWLLILMMIAIFVVQRTQGGCIEEEKKALLAIKTSLSNFFATDRLLPTWVDHGSTASGSGGECCDWERVKCNKTTGHVTELSLGNLMAIMMDSGYTIYNYVQLRHWNVYHKWWPLNVYLFLHFEELRSLNLSKNFLDNGIVNTGLKRLSSLKKLEMLDLSKNYHIDNNILPSLSALTSLRILDLSYTGMKGYFPTNEFAALENLEMLDLTYCGFYGTFQMQGFERVSILRKLKTLNLGFNRFNESLMTSLSARPSLKALDLSYNQLSGSFPAQELAHLPNLEKLDLSRNRLNRTSTVQGCKSLSRLKMLEIISLAHNSFNKSIISCLSALPSLKILDLGGSLRLESSFPIQELSGLRELETLDLSRCSLDSLAFNGIMSRLVHLNLDFNDFGKDIMRLMGAFPSLRFLSLERCEMEGALFAEGLPNMPDLEVLLLGDNRFNGTLPMKALAYFHHLEVLDLSLNFFVGSIPPTIQALSSLQVLSLAFNELNDSLPEHGFCELKNLHELDLRRNMLEGNLPHCFNSLSSLKLFDISSNQFKGILLPSLISNLTSLEYIDFSHNKFEGSLSLSSFSNHTKLEVVVFTGDNDKFEVETEEPLGWVPMFQLKALVLSNCNINRPTRSVVPGFLLHQHELNVLDLSHNSLEGQLPNWLIENNTMLQVLKLRNNSFGGSFRMPSYRHVNLMSLDMSENHIIGTIPGDAQKFLPYLNCLNLSRNALSGALSSSIGDQSELAVLDLSDNDFSGEVPKGLLTNVTWLTILKLSNNRLHGQVLSGNLSLGNLQMLLLDSNCFTGKIGNETSNYLDLWTLDISNNSFSGVLPSWISNLSTTRNATLVVRNNRFEGQFPCGKTPFSFLDISQNSFSSSIPSCLNLHYTMHLHFGSNRFTGSIPQSFRNLTNVLTLDMGNNNLSGRIPKFLGELSNLRILILSKNNFSGSIPKQLCQLSNMSLIDLFSNSLSGSIPRCLQNITGPSYLAFIRGTTWSNIGDSIFKYGSVLTSHFPITTTYGVLEKRDEVQFTTKSVSLLYKGNSLDYMTGLDLSYNKLIGEIPEELGLLTQMRALNLSHNQLTGPIPAQFSNLAKIESLDLSSNGLSGEVPSQLIKLNSLSTFIVAHNNLSGRLPEMKAQFSTFTKDSYEGNPLLCGPPLEKKCTSKLPLTVPSAKKDTEKWYDIDMACFFGSFSSTLVVFLLGFATILYTNPYWRRRWLSFIEECMYTCYYFLCDSARKLSMFLYK